MNSETALATLSKYLKPLFILSLACSAPTALGMSNAVKSGTYVGYLKMDGIDAKIPATLEMERLDNLAHLDIDLMAILKLSFGGFESHEYITQYYFLNDLDPDSHKIVFDGNVDGNGPDISFTKGVVSQDGRRFSARIRSVESGGRRGRLELVYYQDENSVVELANLFPETPEIQETISGRYHGECKTSRYAITDLQIEAIKTTDSISHITRRSLSGYSLYIRGANSTNKRVQKIAGQKEDVPTVIFVMQDADYNFYHRRLSIPSLGGECQVTNEGLSCGSGERKCSFRRSRAPGHDFRETWKMDDQYTNRSKSKKMPIDLSQSASLSAPYDRDDVVNDYHGYVHIEGRNVLEYLTLEVSLTGRPDQKSVDDPSYGLRQPNISVLGKIFVGTGDLYSSNYIHFKYESTPFPRKNFKELVLFGNSEGQDSILKITKWTREGLEGVLYSKSFGRVGRFVVHKSEDGALVDELHSKELCSQPLAGRYEIKKKHASGLDNGVEIQVGITPTDNGRNAIGRPTAPYFPYDLTGSTTYFVVLERQHRVKNPISSRWVQSMVGIKGDGDDDDSAFSIIESITDSYRKSGNFVEHTIPTKVHPRSSFDPFTGMAFIAVKDTTGYYGKIKKSGEFVAYRLGGSGIFLPLFPLETKVFTKK